MKCYNIAMLLRGNMLYYSMSKTITQIEDENITAEFVRIGGLFSLVAHHLLKTYTRKEGLVIKNQYNMESIPTGYRGIVPKSLFIGGKLLEVEN